MNTLLDGLCLELDKRLNLSVRIIDTDMGWHWRHIRISMPRSNEAIMVSIGDNVMDLRHNIRSDDPYPVTISEPDIKSIDISNPDIDPVREVCKFTDMALKLSNNLHKCKLHFGDERADSVNGSTQDRQS